MTDFAQYHAELRQVAREVLSAASPLSRGGREPAPPGWDLLARSGWLGLEVPEALDGAGATFSEVGVVLEEMGAAATLSSYMGSTVLGIGALNMLEPGAGRDGLLRAAGSGELRLAVALNVDEDTGTSPAPFALRRSPSGIRVHGEARFVPDGADADRLLLVASDGEEPVVVLVDAGCRGLSRVVVEVTDSTRRVARVTADSVEVAEGDVRRFAGDAQMAVRRLFDRGVLALASDSLGLSRAMLESTVGYARVRQQFGRPIGSFQAVKHACADMFVQISVGQELVWSAMAAMADGAPDAWVAVAQAKSHVCEAAVEVAGKALQLHGGIGYTWESGIHFYLKRAMFNRSWFGSPAWHRRRLAARFC